MSDNKEVFYYDPVLDITYYSLQELADALGVRAYDLKVEITRCRGSVAFAINRIIEKQQEDSIKKYKLNEELYSLNELLKILKVSKNVFKQMQTKRRNEPGGIEKWIAERAKMIAEKSKQEEKPKNIRKFKAEQKEELLNNLATENGLDFENLKSAYRIQNGDVDRAVAQVKMKNARRTKLNLRDRETNIANAAFVFGLKQRELILALYNNIPIENLKCKEYGQEEDRDGIIAVFEQDLSDLGSWRRWIALRRIYGENIKNSYSPIYTLKLKNYITQEYGALLRILVKEEQDKEKKYTKFIYKLSSFELPIEELLEKHILEEQCETMDLNLEAMKYMYMVSASEIITDDEKETMLSQVSPSEEESQCIEDVKEKMRRLNRLIQLNEVAKVLESNSTLQEKGECLKEYEITSEEIEIIILELYDRNDLFSGEGISEKYFQRRDVINDKIKKWSYMTEDERDKLQKNDYFSDDEKEEIEYKSRVLEHYKAIIDKNNRESQQTQK